MVIVVLTVSLRPVFSWSYSAAIVIILHSSLCLSVMLWIVALVAKVIHPTAKVSEQVNKKCFLLTKFYNFNPLWTNSVNAIWCINQNLTANKISVSGIAFVVSIEQVYSRQCLAIGLAHFLWIRHCCKAMECSTLYIIIVAWRLSSSLIMNAERTVQWK